MKNAILKLRAKHGRDSLIGGLCDMVLGVQDETRYTDIKRMSYNGQYRAGEVMERVTVIHEI